MPSEIYTVSQYSHLLGVSDKTVYRWIKAGVIEASKTSRKGGYLITSPASKLFVRNKQIYFRFKNKVIQQDNPFTAF